MKKLLIFILLPLIFSCDLFNKPSDPDFLDKLYAEVAYANAPWVPLRIEPGILGTASLMGSQHRTVKLGYSFKLVFQPDRNYPFQGWQAWVDGSEPWSSYWMIDGTTGGENRVKFVPLNDEGTEVEIFVYQMPPDGLELFIGPMGAARDELLVQPDSGVGVGLGIIFPARLTGIMQGYPFTMSFSPSASYPFRGWQIVFKDGTVSEWEVGDDDYRDEHVNWAPQNAFGTEIRITIENLPEGLTNADVIIVGPIGMDSPELNINLTSGGLGTVTSTVTEISPARLGYSFALSFSPAAGFPFRGWQIVFKDGHVSVWEAELEEHIDEYVSCKNVFGEMRITIINLPDGVKSEDEITIMPLGAESRPARGQIFVPTGRGSANMTTFENRRQGFPFTIEFTPSAQWAFDEWRAYTDSDFEEHIKDNSIVEFDNAGDLRTQVTINTDALVFLVPFCLERPRVAQTNPPLIGSGISYTRGQQITIWMDLGFEQDTELDFGTNSDGEQMILINGQRIAGDPLGELEDNFEKPKYIASSKTIVISPVTTSENLYPPGSSNITVTIGTGIKNANGVGMSAPIMFSYRTNNLIVTRAYKASNVWANHNPANDSRIESFFFQTAPTDRDRRLRTKNNQGQYEVTLYFGVSRSVGEITEEEPTHLIITEIYYANLAGQQVMPVKPWLAIYEEEGGHRVRKLASAAITKNIEGHNNADGIYRLMNPITNPLGMEYYKAVYTFPENSPAGIYRLAVQPLRQGGGANAVAADDWQIAVADGNFVTVVLDDKAPGGTGRMNFSGHYRFDQNINGNNVFVYSRDDKYLTMESDFQSVHDNISTGGILLQNANPNLPWTMDEQRNLFWQWRLVNAQGESLTDYSQWLPFGTNQTPFDLSILTVSDLVYDHDDDVMEVRVRYRDSLENATDPEEESVLGRIAYVEPPPSAPATNWSATYNETARVVTIRWTTPSMMENVDVFIGNSADPIATIAGAGEKTYHYTAGDPVNLVINENGITAAPNSLREITINLRARRVGYAHEYLEDPIVIWNIPGMSVSEEHPAIKITDGAQLIGNNALFTSSIGKTYVITEEITLSNSHIPIGTQENPFMGKIYGTGKKITVDDFASGQQYNGLFGFVNNAVIQYLDVVYPANTIDIDASATEPDTFVGGLAASVSNTNINSCVVRGSGFNLQNDASGTRTNIYIGGIAGRMTSGQINNSIGAINVGAIINENITNIFAGGLSGTAGPVISLTSSIVSGKEIMVSISSGIRRQLRFWWANEVRSGSGNSITIQGAALTNIKPQFEMIFIVDKFTDSSDAVNTEGTLRHAIANLENGDIISFDIPAGSAGTADYTINLSSPLPPIEKSVTIEGNGITLTRAAGWTETSDTSQLLRVDNTSADVTISRVHFKDGRATGNGGALFSNANLTIESCIFSGNSSSRGGAVYNEGIMVVRGCTFYNNTGDFGGAIFTDGPRTPSLTLTGNLFFGNHYTGSTNNGHVVRRSDNRTLTSSYNVVDIPYGNGGNQTGFARGTDEIEALGIKPLSSDNFRLYTTTYTNANTPIGAVSAIPDGYPTVDFYGTAISGPAANAGAVQSTIDGSAGVLFVNTFTDNSAAATTAGTLRWAITNASAGYTIRIGTAVTRVTAGSTTIILSSPLEITRSLTIEGNSITITRASNWTSGNNSQMMRINDATATAIVTIRRIHFRDGLSTGRGAAINNSAGTVTIESCIFSGNNASTGGAVGNAGADASTTIRACTFYNNHGSSSGGAISNNIGTLHYSGNLFYANTNGALLSRSSVYHQSGTTTSQGFNRYDVTPSWTDPISSDALIANDVPPASRFSNYRVVSGGGAAGIITVTNRPAGYPTVDFLGDPIPATSNASAGAVQSTTDNGFLMVTSTEDNGNNTLRNALSNVVNGDVIYISVSSDIRPSSTITINRNQRFTIEGNGATIRRTMSGTYRFLTKESGNVTIRRVHFINGNAGSSHGGAISNAGGDLTLESCIFNGNQTLNNNVGNGGAISQSSTGALIVRGCTFYNNNANLGGAITFDDGSLTITGNLFYGSTARVGMPILNRGSRTISSSYNVVDYPFEGTNSTLYTHSGFAAGTGNISIPSVPLIVTTDNADFLKPHNFEGGAASAVPASPSRPDGYPTVDFNGTPIPADTAIYAGAIQTGVAADRRYVIIGATRDALHAAITDANSRGTSDLGDIIAFSNVTPGDNTISITNSSLLPQIIRNMTILGNGIIIQGSGGTFTSFATFDTIAGNTQLLRVGGNSSFRPTVTIERVHFRGGRASTGAAIQNNGTVFLRSCIFSNNHAREHDNSWQTHGGTIRNENDSTMTVIGCTFYANAVSNRTTYTSVGAAIYNSGSLTITGNIFYGNNSFNNNLHIIRPGSTFTSNGYNIVDRAFGSAATQAGYATIPNTDATIPTLSSESGTAFVFGTAPIDTTNFTPASINVTPNVGTASALQTRIPSGNWARDNMPLTDFYGKPRVWPGAPGAVRQP